MTTLIDDEGDELTRVDLNALERAIAMARLESPGRSQQLDDKLANEPWQRVAEFAAYCCQCDNLHLKPWQPPPCWVNDLVADIQRGDDGIHGHYAAARLLQRMLDHGISRYEPDPLKA